MRCAARAIRGVALAGLLALILALGAPGGAAAQSADTGRTAPAVAQETSAAELEDLIATLENDAERKAFVARLRTLLEAKRAAADKTTTAQPGGSLGGQVMAETARRMTAVTTRMEQAAGALAQIPEAALAAGQALGDPGVRRRWAIMVGEVLAALLAGALAERLFVALLARPRARLAPREAVSMPARLLLNLGRIVVDAVPLVALAAAAWLLIAVLGITGPAAVITAILVNAMLISRGAAIAGRAALAPRTPTLRLLELGDAAAGYLYRWVRRVAVPGIYGVLGLRAAGVAGLNPGVQALLLKLLGFALALLVIVFVLQNRRRVAAWLAGDADGWGRQVATLRRRLADLWHLLAIVYVLAAYGVWALGIKGGFPFLMEATALTLLIGLVARGLHLAVTRLLDKGVALAPRFQASYPTLETRLNRYVPTARRVLDVALLVAAGVFILQAWDLDVLAVLETPPGRRLVSVLVSLGVVLLLALGAWEVVNALLERLNRRAARGVAPKRSARVQTLLPLLRNVFRIVLITIATLIGLSEIGVNIAPLLAGAGVIGLAIGFGSQTLVKDVITGVFILAEDSLALGDWVEAGGHMGEVENLTIRTITLRDLQGQVHVVPFSEVTSILNMSRDYGHAIIDVDVAYREDTDQVTELLKAVDRDLRADPEWAPRIRGELEVFGVNDLGDSAVTVRVRVKTQPVMQWAVRREFLRRTKKLFDARGVEIPFPHRTLYFGADKQGDAPPARVAMTRDPAAAASAPASAAPAPTGTSTAPDAA